MCIAFIFGFPRLLEAAARAATAKSMPSVVERLIQRNSNVTRIYVSKIEFFIHLMRIISFLGLAVIFYTPLDGNWFNQPVGGWDANRTIDSWGIFLWDWDWIDCVYFAMVTMTTVGYGDNPTLSQGLRIFTIFFACLGVVFVAGSINVIADWFSEQGQKRFIAQQRVVLENSHRVAAVLKGKGTVVLGTVEEEGTRQTPVARQRERSSIAVACDAASSWASSCFELILRRLPDMKFLGRLQALRLAFVFFCLCIILGEVENYQIEGCGGFGAGWSCGGNVGCDAWKLSHENGGYCWSWVDEFYFGIITYLTIGYGDVHPHTKGGKLLAAFLVVFGVLSFSTLLTEINVMVRFGADKTLRQRLVDLREVIEQDDNHMVTSGEFIFFNLKKMGKVDEDIIHLLKEQFKALDMDSSGELDANDIAKLSASANQLSQQKQKASGRHGARNVRGSINSALPLRELANLELATMEQAGEQGEGLGASNRSVAGSVASPAGAVASTSSKNDESHLLQQHQAAASSGSSLQGSVAVADDVEEGEEDDEGETFGDLPPPSPDFRATIARAEQQSMSNELSPMQKLMSGLGQLSTRMGSYFSPAEVEQELPTRISIPANRSPQRLQVAQDLKPKFDGTLVPVRV